MRVTLFGASLSLGMLGACGGQSLPAPSRDAGAVRADAHTPEPFSPTDATRAYCRDADDARVEARITELLRALTLEEKVRLMAGAGALAVDRSWRVPGHEALGIPGLRMLDGPRGLSAVTRAPATVFPVAMARGASWDEALERRVGEAIADELRSVGANVLLAPTMNVLRHPRWGRAQETYGEDPVHIGAMAVAFIEGVQSRGVLASAKHYAANSIENTRHSVDVRLDERTLREVYLPHFRRAVIDGRVASVMTAYNRVNGAWADQSAALLRGILKGEWGFAGFVESDWILGTHGSVDSVRAGLDIEMPLPIHFRRLPAEVRAGALGEREIDDSARRILRAQLCYGLDARPFVADDPSLRDTPGHRALAREAARAGIVLLENDLVGSTPALPFGAEVRRVVVLGRNAAVENLGDRGSSNVVPSEVVTALEGISARGVEVTHLRGAQVDAAGETALRGADAVVVVTGLQSDDEGEGEIGAGDRRTLELGADEVALIRRAASLNSRVVVVIEAGAAVTVAPWIDEVEALLFTAYPGCEGGAAIAEVLFGDHGPSGRLPFVIPMREADLVPFDDASEVVRYEHAHGYRALAERGLRAAYDFGFGMTYTRFERSDATTSAPSIALDGAVELTLTLRNVGATRGTDTVQVYASPPGAPRDRRLVGFSRVTLEPGGAERVRVTIHGRDLARWDLGASRWSLGAGAHRLVVAESAAAQGISLSVAAR